MKVVEKDTPLSRAVNNNLRQWISLGYIMSMTPIVFHRKQMEYRAYTVLEKNLEFQLVHRAISSHILLVQGQLLLVLVKDFIRG